MALGGGIIAAMINGTKRGLFSNEAGQGTAPNAAATATVSHPVRQGLIQSLGVFIDTIVVCTATAFVILLAGPEVWGGDGVDPSNLTTLAVANELGAWTIVPMAILIFVLAYSSVIAAYVYSDTNMSFVFGDAPWATWTVRVVCVVSATVGARAELGCRVECRRHRDGGHDDHELGRPRLPVALGRWGAQGLPGAAQGWRRGSRLCWPQQPALAARCPGQRLEAPQEQEALT